MRISSVPAIIVAWLISMTATYVAADHGSIWLSDLEEAKADAKSAGKDLLILFTAPGRLQPCALADRELIQQPNFTSSLSDSYVLVQLDFDFGDSEEDRARRAELLQLRSHFLAPVLPTVVLTDSAGLPYAFVTGYAPETTVNAYLDHITNAREAKRKRDELLVAADSLSGEIRAQYLSDALACIEPQLGKIAERGDDPLLHFYANRVEEILDLTSSEGNLADKYLSQRKRRQDWVSGISALETLKLIEATKNLDGATSRDYDGALLYLESCLRRVDGADVKWQLERSRQAYLEWSERYTESLANCRRLLLLEGLNDTDRDFLFRSETYCLCRLGRVDEALLLYDRRIQAAGDDPDKRLGLIGSKAQMAAGHGSTDQSIPALQAYRSAALIGTDHWLTATVMLARELRKIDRHSEALELVNEYLEQRSEPYLMLDAAESYIALRKFGEASRSLAEAELASASLAESSKESDRRNAERLATRIKGLKKQILDGLKSARD